MTAQVSDVQVLTQPGDDLVLAHGIFAFLFNTVVSGVVDQPVRRLSSRIPAAIAVRAETCTTDYLEGATR